MWLKVMNSTFYSVIKLGFHILILQEAYLSNHEMTSTTLFKWKDSWQKIKFIELFILMKLKATFTYLISKGGLQAYRVLQSFSCVIKISIF